MREQTGGRMSRRARRAHLGPASGSRWARRWGDSVPPSRRRARASYVAFAAGSGITPVLSLATDILAREPQSRFTLIYGNRSMARTMFLEDTLALKNRHLGRFSVYFVMSREPQQAPLLNGRIDAAKVEALAAQLADIARADEYFVCGPGDMVDEVRGAIQRLNPGAPVRFERFAAAQRAPAARTAAREHGCGEHRRAAAGRGAGADLGRHGRAPPQLSPMAPTDGSVLAAAERAGLDLPFSCRAGICATCRTKLKSGRAVMAHNIALEPWEVDAGFILCCQARPSHRFAGADL